MNSVKTRVAREAESMWRRCRSFCTDTCQAYILKMVTSEKSVENAIVSMCAEFIAIKGRLRVVRAIEARNNTVG